MASSRDLNGAVVAVVGATGGLGSAITEVLRARGAKVIRANRTGADGAEVQLDVRDADAGATLAKHVEASHGRLDGVVIASGVVAFGDLADTDDVVIEELFLTNTMGPLWMAKALMPLLTESQGFFVNISGVVAAQPMPGMAAYSASKAAAAAAFDAVRKEVRRAKVHVVDVQPPHTETGLATRPLAGTAPQMAEGLAPSVVAARVVEAIEANERQVTADQFG